MRQSVRTLPLVIVVAGLAAFSTAPASAQDIDFGDDAGEWDHDGQCDDPRFAGPGMASVLYDEDIMHDATDCRTLFEAGRIHEAGAEPAPEPSPAPSGKAGQSAGTAAMSDMGVDFGDDTSAWANDGVCDDPRFEGDGVSSILLDEDEGHDATDCQALFEAGEVTLAADAAPAAPAGKGSQASAGTGAGGIDFGDDEGVWANDGECDDPRFEGAGVSGVGSGSDIGHDASDCRAAFEAGEATLRDFGSGPTVPIEDVDFGDDSGPFTRDGECDDPRFEGLGMAGSTDTASLRADATDCRTAYADGLISLKEIAPLPDVDLGDDAGFWANNGECDDPRFAGPGMAVKNLPEDIMHDATDCRAMLEAGRVALRPASDAEIDFGDNSGTFPNDAECDDPRFIGPGASGFMDDTEIGGDADDCREGVEAGTVRLR